MCEIFLVIMTIISIGCAHSFYLRTKELEAYLEPRQMPIDYKSELIKKLQKEDTKCQVSKTS